MKSFMKNGNAFFIMILTFVFLLLLAKIPEGYPVHIFGIDYKIKKLDMLQDVIADSVMNTETPAAEAPTSSLLNGHAEFAGSILRIFEDFTAKADMLAAGSVVRETPAAPAPKIENAGHLKKFFDAVKASGSKKIRIAHFGDSAIEGDNISADVRKTLQSKYGGNGVGVVGVNLADVAFRMTTNVKFSTDWKTTSIITSNPEKLTGINGYVYQAAANSWVSYEASGRYNVKSFSVARILYSSDKNFSIKYEFDGKGEKSVELKASKSPVEYVLDPKAKVKSVKITVVNPSKTYFYGVALEEGNGLYLDNYPLRGNNGTNLRDLDVNTLKSFDKLLGYKLIVLNFGLNIAGADQKDYGWYESAMNKVVEQFKQAFPDASILIVSVQDKSKKKGTAWVTEDGIPKLVAAQKNISAKNGVAFFNLFEAMGGMNSMSKWVDQELAEKDYTHMKLAGSKKIADLITDAIFEASR